MGEWRGGRVLNREVGSVILRLLPLPFMLDGGGVCFFKLPYRFFCEHILLIDPLIVQVVVSLPLDQILQFAVSAEMP